MAPAFLWACEKASRFHSPHHDPAARVEAARSLPSKKRKWTAKLDFVSYLERATRLELVTGIPKMASGHFQEPCRTSN